MFFEYWDLSQQGLTLSLAVLSTIKILFVWTVISSIVSKMIAVVDRVYNTKALVNKSK